MRADLTVWGRYYACSDWSCASTVVYWMTPQFLLEPTRAGWFRLVFHLRNGEVVRDSVLVVARQRQEGAVPTSLPAAIMMRQRQRG